MRSSKNFPSKRSWTRNNKATLKLHNPRKEKTVGRFDTKPYDDKPLFYGLPTMEAWLRWRAIQLDKMIKKD